MDRQARLNKLFNEILSGKKPISPSNGPQFLEAIYNHPKPTDCIATLVAKKPGVEAFKAAIRYDLSPNFLNTHASSILRYLQDPELKAINNGDFLNGILMSLVDPPIFWTELRKVFIRRELDDEAMYSFGWLLHRLCTMASDHANTFREESDMDKILNILLSSSVQKTKSIGTKIKEALSTSLPIVQGNITASSGPGGRHNNDFAEFRKISILPTGEEMVSKDAPFLRPASVLEDPETASTRVAIHLDNQFRLLREDMIHEMREELQIAFGTKKGRHRGTKIQGLQLKELELGDVKKRLKWSLVCVCDHDFPEMKKFKKPQDRKDFLINKRQFFRHQSLACLLVGTEIIAFPCIHRDEERLAKNPPEIVLQFEDAESTQHALLRLKMGDHVTLIQIDTATFAYEPILKGLQQAKALPLSSDILLWKKGDPLEEIAEQSPSLVQTLRNDPNINLKTILQTPKDIHLDDSQARSLISGLTQNVSLIQGPPGTGKSFIGGLIAKAIHNLTNKTILVVCYTNHALDDILTHLLDIGIPASSMLRIGGKSTTRTEPLTLQRQARGPATSRIEWTAIDELKAQVAQLRNRVQSSFAQYNSQTSYTNLLDYLEMEYPDYFEAFAIPDQDDGVFLVGARGKAAQPDYLIEKWVHGKHPGRAFIDSISASKSKQAIWDLPYADRQAHLKSWQTALLQEGIDAFVTNAKEYNRCVDRLNRAFSTNTTNILRSKRIVGCTTTGAAKYREEIHIFNPDVLLVEEAGEILESHVLTSLGPETSQMVLIGDHKQLRPKVNHYLLTVENGEGYDLNRSLFERLILKDYPHETLEKQHRMRPEISDLIRQLTYPKLIDAPDTQNRPDLLGIQDNIVFIQHDHPEDEHPGLSDRSDMTSKSSKQNSFEASMILKIVKYLGQQGYGTENLVILTPYLGQLQKLREMLKKDNDPILNDLDNSELLKAGLIDPGMAKLTKRPIRLATIDNYQGEESDVVIVSLTRSNARHDIGFMCAPERLNVLLSRARNALIMLGNADTFKNARKGKELWHQFFDLLVHGKHIYHGLPVKCERHPNTTAILSKVDDFDSECPDGGCLLPCGTTLSCGIHTCRSKCHQLANHSKVPCTEIMTSKCPDGHTLNWECTKGPPVGCSKCERAKKLAKQKQEEEIKAQSRRDEEQKAHLAKMDALNALIDEEKRKAEDTRLSQERANALLQKEKDLEIMKAANLKPVTPTPMPPSTSTQPLSTPSNPSTSSSQQYTTPQSQTPRGNEAASSGNTTPTGSKTEVPAEPTSDSGNDRIHSTIPASGGKPFKDPGESPAKKEWNRQKSMEGAQNDAIDAIMDMIGLEAVKQGVLDIKAKIDVSIRQGSTLKRERFNAVLLGNPGTGKTTVARHYAKFLSNVKAIPGETFEETTGARLAQNGVGEATKLVEGVVKAGGGAIFIDEAYQLTSGNNYGGPAVLDFLLAEMENRVGMLVFIFAGYNKEMEKFFEHNPGLKSRVPYEFQFADYEDVELMRMLEDYIKKDYAGRMKVEGEITGLYGRIAIRRLGKRRGRAGFGNARDLQTVLSHIKKRQAVRLTKERQEGKQPDDFLMTREDLIGPDPTTAIKESKGWIRLQNMIGLKAVKESIRSLFSSIEENYQRELLEQGVLDFSLNKVFLGPPGTGKTTVAKLYGGILVDIGLLSNGEVVLKNPSDFVGSVVGASEANTKAILANTAGKVLIIDEAYMLYGGGGGDNSSSGSNQYKTSVIDTIVAEVQNVPGEDRCVILAGYKDQMLEMFQNVNPGLSRRFKIEDAFHFENFNDAELLQILEFKLKDQDLDATPQAKKAAIDCLSRMRNRPNFGNAGEVENLISAAKARAIARRSKIPLADRPLSIVFEAEDIDPDWNRSANASTDLVKLFSDIVGCEDIIHKLKNYQRVVEACMANDLDPRELVPTNFVFTGPPGTGKTTVARKIGQVFYNMGILGSQEVIECSASDLVGQYVGQTGPKTKKLFEKALGKVLFVDEAYRLSVGHFAQEAIDELVGLLTHPDFKGKLIVILAGYEKDMNQLMSVNTGLSSRFPDQVVFVNMDAERCLKVISNELKKKGVQTDGWDRDGSSEANLEVKELIRDLSELPDWGNARDMITMSKEMISKAFVSNASAKPGTEPILSGDVAVTVMKNSLADRRRRAQIPPSSRRIPDDLPMQDFTAGPPPAPIIATTTKTNTQGTFERGRGRGRGRGGGRGGRGGVEVRAAPNQTQSGGQVQRDPGVSDALWNQMKEATRQANRIENEAKNRVKEIERKAEESMKEAQRQERVIADMQRAEAAAKDASERAEMQRQREEARLKALAARAAQEQADAEARARRQAENHRREQEAKAQVKLRQMGVCVAGFRWIKMHGGYRCEAGGHFVSDAALGL